MSNNNLQELTTEASDLALSNNWGEHAYKVNMKILELDDSNSAACTRLAKYYKLNDNLNDAKEMYKKALVINPNNNGARNNLREIEKYQEEKEFIDNLTTSRDLFNAGRSLSLKRKYNLSIKCYLKAYSMEPLLKYAITVGKMYKKLEKYDEVKKLYNQIVESNPTRDDIDDVNAEFKLLLQR